MRKRIKWTKMYICLLLLSAVYGALLFRFYFAEGRTQPAPQQMVTQRSAEPVEVHRTALNTADREELMLLPGIGETLADRILACREEKGGFSSIEELLQVKGIGEKTLENLKDYVVLEEEQP